MLRKMDKLLIASNNPKKIIEIKEILGDFFDEFYTFNDFGLESPEENGTTFEENSLIKGVYGCRKTGMITLADDSGLCVDYLNGEPGVYSARYAETGNDVKNYQKLLEKLQGVPYDQRTAYFISVIALVYPDGKKIICEGKVEGIISTEPKGDNGFGYDPVFYLPQYRCTMAQLSKDAKNKISHRSIALKKLKEQLEGRS
ncbi:XTP/dITP diphosphohydrolase [Anaerobranca californiensis DSM 14826]|jgi:XTP/dITP diphosphohydrolase|uniref:dITP/XTP pyrophosphatase n=2 Tax=Anaerobranca TaxID=42447 RepID=A0A1M6P852_9FIRM|nr:XTP/dITP diphosphohydrolase [Anaerobranca californiensis DSM 14826]